jgi:endonuclease III
MALPNRAALIKKTVRVLRKHFTAYTPAKDRTLLEHMLFACLLENSNHEAAEKAYASVTKNYFDLNEVRVSSVKELSESFEGLVDPTESAARLKRTLHSMFETFYTFDVEILKKQNIGQAVKTIEGYYGSTPFVVAYVTQTALNGHAIPVNDGLMLSFQTIGIVTSSEVKKRVVPGLERTIPKSRGIEVASLLHSLGVEVGRNPYGQVARKLLLEINPACKDRLPKRSPKPREKQPDPPKEQKEVATKKKLSKKDGQKTSKPTGKSKSGQTASKPAAKKTAKKTTKKTAKKTTKKTAKKTTAAKQKVKKKTGLTKKVVKKKTTTKKMNLKKKNLSRRLSKKKPR